MKVNGETLKMILDSLSEMTQLVRSLEARISLLEVNQRPRQVPCPTTEDLPLKFTGIDESRFTGINLDYQFPKQSLVGGAFSVTREQDGI